MKRLVLASLIMCFVLSAPSFATTFKAGDLVVANFIGGTVDRYDVTTGAKVETLAGAGIAGAPGISPIEVAFAPNGDLWVAAFNSARIDVYNEAGFVKSINTVVNPEGMAFGADGNAYVIGRYDMKVMKVNPTTGVSTLLADVGAAVAGISQTPDLAFGPDGNIYVTASNMTVQRFNSSTGTHMGTFASGVPGSAVKYLTFGRENSMFVASYYGHAVAAFNATTGAKEGTQYSGINYACGVAVGLDDTLYVSNWNANSITKFDENDNRQNNWSTAVSYPAGMAIIPVPEPVSLTLLGLGGFALLRRKR